MRPRVFPAEDPPVCATAARPTPCFNEAAGIPRGRLGLQLVPWLAARASMRPRVFPAEDRLKGAALDMGASTLQ